MGLRFSFSQFSAAAMNMQSDSENELRGASGTSCRISRRKPLVWLAEAGRLNLKTLASFRNVSRILFILLVLPGLSTGCQLTPTATFSADRPSQHSVASQHFVIHSDVPIESGDPLVKELEDLQRQITASLQLPEPRDPVMLYLFTDEVTYRYFMQAKWSNLPPRRAYFVGTPRELAVYSFRSPRMLEDLRHEFTHGILHASLTTVPLWLDEGLAEYFEIRSTEPGAPHREHLHELAKAKDEGWRPNLFRLETISDFQNLTQRDYAESWAWVHFLLNNDVAGRDALLAYVAELRSTTTPQRLLPAVEKAAPNFYTGLQNHIASLYAATMVASGP
jgi:hypothetical protein